MSTTVLDREVQKWASKGSTPVGRGVNHAVWIDGPDGTKWLWKAATIGHENGYQNEVAFTELAREAGLMTYDVLLVKRGGRSVGVLLRNAADANPGWRLIGHPYDATWGLNQADPIRDLPPSAWLPAAVFSAITSLKDRHNGNAIVLRNDDTGEMSVVHVDHELGVGTYPQWPNWLSETTAYLSTNTNGYQDSYRVRHHQPASEWAVIAEVVDQVMTLGDRVDERVLEQFLDSLRRGRVGHVVKGAA